MKIEYSGLLRNVLRNKKKRVKIHPFLSSAFLSVIILKDSYVLPPADEFAGCRHQ